MPELPKKPHPKTPTHGTSPFPFPGQAKTCLQLVSLCVARTALVLITGKRQSSFRASHNIRRSKWHGAFADYTARHLNSDFSPSSMGKTRLKPQISAPACLVGAGGVNVLFGLVLFACLFQNNLGK